VIILKRDPSQSETVRQMEPSLALGVLDENDYFNPHLLMKNDFKRSLRTQFFRQLLASTRVYEVNTRGTPQESQRGIAELLGKV
jgi:hypothetical protein